MALQTSPPSVSQDSRIGWIGTGVMGASMCGHLLANGYAVAVTTRTKARAETLLANGAQWADTPAAAAAASDVVISMVGFPEEVREVMFGSTGSLSTARRGTVIIDMSTSEPALAVE